MRIQKLIPVILLLAGCSGSDNLNDLRQFTDEAFKGNKPEIEPLPPLQPSAVFIYTASGQVDPFDANNLQQKQAEEVAEQGEAGPDLSRRKEPLESYPIDRLKLVGMLAKDGINWAIIHAPDQSVHRITEGNYMGENHGEIVRTDESSITAVELIKNPTGKWEKKEVKINLVE